MSNKFEEPDVEEIWPCKSCGAEQAPAYSVNHRGEVMDCANCGLIGEDMHIDSPKCWCHPVKIDGEDGPILIHNMKH